MEFMRSATTLYMLEEFAREARSKPTIASLCDWILQTYNLTSSPDKHLEVSSSLLIELSTHLMVEIHHLTPVNCQSMTSKIYMIALDLKHALEEWKFAIGTSVGDGRKAVEKVAL